MQQDLYELLSSPQQSGLAIPAIVAGLGIVMIWVELLRPRNKWPQVATWWLRAISLNAVQVGSVFIAGVAWDSWFPEMSFWSTKPLGTTLGAILGYLVLTFIYYWWHRWRHEVDFLWRWFHQIHHSVQRLEVIASFYKHPFEILMNGVLSSAVLYLLVGATPESASIAVLMAGFAELFYHWNVATPYWVGFFFQRPESHCVHHQKDHHSQNYSDLPLWDMLFGTFHNPRTFTEECGFSDDRELRLGEMLAGVDVHKKKPA